MQAEKTKTAQACILFGIFLSRQAGHFPSDRWVTFVRDRVGHFSSEFPLMKEDLADMAESLVRMTCLKRHFTTDEETVGGPVDVAVATRGDGFVWIKRKHYFSADLNHHYFER